MATSVEQRSILSGPIRRSLERLEANGSNVADAVNELSAKVDELILQSERLMVVATPRSGNVSIGPDAVANVTNTISIQTVPDHYYRLAMRVRATSSVPPAGAQVLLRIDGTITGDAWIYIGGNYQGYTHEWLYKGVDAGTHSFVGAMQAEGDIVVFVSTDSHFYCEHLGELTP